MRASLPFINQSREVMVAWIFGPAKWQSWRRIVRSQCCITNTKVARICSSNHHISSLQLGTTNDIACTPCGHCMHRYKNYSTMGVHSIYEYIHNKNIYDSSLGILQHKIMYRVSSYNDILCSCKHKLYLHKLTIVGLFSAIITYILVLKILNHYNYVYFQHCRKLLSLDQTAGPFQNCCVICLSSTA